MLQLRCINHCKNIVLVVLNESADVTNVWTRLRSATRRIRRKIKVEWALSTDQQLQLQLNGARLRARDVEYSLRSAVREYFRRRLLNTPDQGKVYEVTSASALILHFDLSQKTEKR
jgi:hypothetical protein